MTMASCHFKEIDMLIYHKNTLSIVDVGSSAMASGGIENALIRVAVDYCI